MTKENKSLKIKTSSRRKFFKTAAKSGAVAAATVAMPYVNLGAAQTLKCKLHGQVVLTYFLKWQETIAKWLATCQVDH